MRQTMNGVQWNFLSPLSRVLPGARAQRALAAEGGGAPTDDRVTLGGTTAAPAPAETDQPTASPGRFRLPNWRRALTIGLAGLTLFGGLVANLHADDTRGPLVPQTAQVQLVGDPMGGRLMMEDSSLPGMLSQFKAPALAKPQPFRPAQPKAQVGDYIKHGVNFSQLLSNAEFTRSDAATKQEIQDYLSGKGSFLANYAEGQLTAADIIVQAAQKSQINPWVVLSTLEKENSMVSRQSKPRARVISASMGYGHTDGGKTIGKSGFQHQVTKGAELLRQLYDEAQGQTFPTKVRVDYKKRTIQVDNAATLALMRYTPHTVDTHLKQVGGGNFLFRKHLEAFTSQNFDQVMARYDSTLLASSGTTDRL